MTESVLDVKCKHCNNDYYGVLQGIFRINAEYATTCPHCNKQNFKRNGVEAHPINISIPDGAVPVEFVKMI